MIMEFIKEWLPLVVLGFNAALFVVIKFNDMHHLQLRFDELMKKVEEIDSKLDLNAERIASIEGRCKANHG